MTRVHDLQPPPNSVKRTAVLPATFLALFALFLFVSGVTASLAMADNSGGYHRQSFDDQERFWSVTTLYSPRPGDLVRLEIQPLQPQGPKPEHVRFHVVEGGQGQALVDGDDVMVIHAGTYPPWGFQFRRPEPPETKEHVVTSQGDLHAAVDLVFLYDRQPHATDAEFESDVIDLRAAVSSLDVDVAGGRWLRWQPVWYTGAGVALVAGAVTAAAWARGRGEPEMDPAASRLEQLLTAQELTRRYLLGLRDAMRVTGALLLVVGIAGLAAALRLVQSLPIPPGRFWEPFMQLGAVFALVGALLLWVIQYGRVVREARRWTETKAPEV